ncbi:MAG: PaaI family thioesterase [Pseudomonadota bacterium]
MTPKPCAAPIQEERIYLPHLEGYRCFACGTDNPVGLAMRFYLSEDGQGACSDVVLSENHVGWETIAHGGIVGTLLDEAMGWAVITFEREWFVTRTMEVRYLRPVPVGAALTVEGRVERRENSLCRASAVLRETGGRPFARASAEMAFLSEKRVQMSPEVHRKAMEDLFVRLLLAVDGPGESS